MTDNTIRGWLDESGFDWQTGNIIVQETALPFDYFGEVVAAYYLEHNSPTLDKPFSEDGRITSPLFMAWDRRRVYFLVRQHGRTSLASILRYPLDYLHWHLDRIPVVGSERD